MFDVLLGNIFLWKFTLKYTGFIFDFIMMQPYIKKTTNMHIVFKLTKNWWLLEIYYFLSHRKSCFFACTKAEYYSEDCNMQQIKAGIVEVIANSSHPTHNKYCCHGGVTAWQSISESVPELLLVLTLICFFHSAFEAD